MTWSHWDSTTHATSKISTRVRTHADAENWKKNSSQICEMQNKTLFLILPPPSCWKYCETVNYKMFVPANVFQKVNSMSVVICNQQLCRHHAWDLFWIGNFWLFFRSFMQTWNLWLCWKGYEALHNGVVKGETTFKCCWPSVTTREYHLSGEIRSAKENCENNLCIPQFHTSNVFAVERLGRTGQG